MQLTTVFVATLLAAVASARAIAPVEERAICPDPLSPCQYANDGKCEHGYAACLQKMGCSNRPDGADCIGTSLGEFFSI